VFQGIIADFHITDKMSGYLIKSMALCAVLKTILFGQGIQELECWPSPVSFLFSA
jgi:hypothetical protein